METINVGLDQHVRIPVGESSVTVPASTILGDLIGRLVPQQKPASEIPRIGEMWVSQGGVYAGVVRGRDGQPDYHLIVGPAIESGGWKKAMDAAAEIEAAGHMDFTLPYRAEQSIQFGNVPELFEKAYYWSREEYAGIPGYAWCTFFDYGGQNLFSKGHACRARAVRRLPIQ